MAVFLQSPVVLLTGASSPLLGLATRPRPAVHLGHVENGGGNGEHSVTVAALQLPSRCTLHVHVAHKADEGSIAVDHG